MRRLLPVLLIIGAPVQARAQSPEDATTSLVAAERAFARDGSARLVNEAFVAVLDSAGVLFRTGPVNGLASLAERPMSATLDLKWTPAYAETAADGLLGFTTGPATFGERGQSPAGSGFFVSVWRRAADRWKLVVDGGIEAPISGPVDSAAVALRTRGSRRWFPDAGDLRAVEQKLIASYTTEFPRLAAVDVRVYRDGSAPTETRAEGVALLRKETLMKWVPSDVVVAGSGDLGYVYGRYDPDGERPRGYLRIYRRADNGDWKLAVDWHN